MKKIGLILFLLGLSFSGYAQVGIGVKTPSKSAMLDIYSPNGDKGVVMPKVSLTDKNVFAPLSGDSKDPNNIGLLVFNQTDNLAKGLTKGYYYWTGNQWSSFSSAEEILNIIEGKLIAGNVYFGSIEAGKSEVLYAKKKNEQGEIINEKIDLLPTVIDNITNTTKDELFDLKQKLGYDITEEVVFTGNSIKGNFIYSFFDVTNIENDNAEVTGIKLSKVCLDLLSKGEVFKIRLLNNKYQLIDISVTDIEVTSGGVLKFSLGTPNFYLTLPEGKYGVIVELLSAKKKI